MAKAKICKNCSKLKDLSLFYNEKRNSDGLTGTCKACFDLRNRIYVRKHKEKVTSYKVAWQKENWTRTYARTSYKYKAESNFRKALKNQRTPKWLTKEQRKDLREIYKNKPNGYEVDHIVPLRGKNVSGLHVPWNLQYLTPNDNRRKSNRYE